MPAKGKSVEQLGDEVFSLVQEAQGKAFVSDGINALSDTKTLFGVIRGHLTKNEEATRILRKWLRKYGEY